jgi:hypothetical protein
MSNKSKPNIENSDNNTSGENKEEVAEHINQTIIGRTKNSVRTCKVSTYY